MTCCYPPKPFFMKKCHGPEDCQPWLSLPSPPWSCPPTLAREQYPTAHSHFQQTLGSAPKQCFLFPHKEKTSSVFPAAWLLSARGCTQPVANHHQLWWLIDDQCLQWFLPSSKPIWPIERFLIKSRGCIVSTFPTTSHWNCYTRKIMPKMSCCVLCFCVEG